MAKNKKEKEREGGVLPQETVSHVDTWTNPTGVVGLPSSSLPLHVGSLSVSPISLPKFYFAFFYSFFALEIGKFFS